MKQSTIKEALNALSYIQAHLGSTKEIEEAIKDLETNLKLT